MRESMILQNIKAGDPSGLKALMERYVPYISVIVWKILRDAMSPQDAEEVVSDVFLAAWEQAADLKAGHVKGWLGTVARNKAKNKLRQMGFSVEKDELEELFEEFKVLADRQKSVSDLDLEALVHRKLMKIHESFKLDRFVINVGNTITTTSAVRLINDKGEEMEAVTSSKFGPIDAS